MTFKIGQRIRVVKDLHNNLESDWRTKLGVIGKTGTIIDDIPDEEEHGDDIDYRYLITFDHSKEHYDALWAGEEIELISATTIDSDGNLE